MLPRTVNTARGDVTLRLAAADDADELIRLNKLCFPAMAEQNVVWNRGQLANHLRVFPQGQIVAELDGRLVGAVATLSVDLGTDAFRPHTYSGITDGGYFHNHDPQGDSLYGADIYVHPDMRSIGVGHELYEERRDLARRLNLRRIIAGGRIHGYAERAASMTPEAYVRGVEDGTLKDLVLSFQLREGFVVRGILRNYINDPLSRNCATFLEWLNPDHVPLRSDRDRKVRIAAVQYQVRRVSSFDDFAEQVEYFVETASDYHADFVIFPEFFSVQLLSQPELKRLSALEGIAELCRMEDRFVELMTRIAREYGIHVIGGSHPIERGSRRFNASPFVFPDGSVIWQPKLHITPSEKRDWGIHGGDELRVIPTAKAKLGILICYDSEFPEATRYLADQGAEILFVPYCTDNQHGYFRVRSCCQARAIENQIYVVTAGIIGNLPSVPAMDIHYGRSAVFSPSDFEFSRDGIQAQADSNVETLLVTDLDIADLYHARASGSVRPVLDRRKDLFELVVNLSNDATRLNPDQGEPIGPSDHVDL